MILTPHYKNHFSILLKEQSTMFWIGMNAEAVNDSEEKPEHRTDVAEMTLERRTILDQEPTHIVPRSSEP